MTLKTMTRKTTRRSLLAGSAAAMLAAPALAAPATSFTVLLDWFINPDHAPLFTAKYIGAFDRAGLDVTFIAPADPSLPPSLLAAGKGDVALSYQTELYLLVDQGLPVRRAGTLINKPLSTLTALGGRGITKLTDLKGKKIATPQHGNTQDIAARHYLTAVLGQTDTKNVLPIANPDQFELMRRGQIDAAWVPEPWGSLLISQAGATLVGQEKDLWPEKEFSLTVIVTTPDFLAAHGDVVQKLLNVNRDWTRQLNEKPADCVPKLEAGLAQLTRKELPAGVVADSLSHVKFTDEPLPATFTANAQWASDLGFAKEKPDLTGLIAIPGK